MVRTGNKLVFYLSDVSGHGLDGAIMSVFVKNTIGSFLDLTPTARLTPEKILRYLAERYNRQNYPDDYFICIFLAVLELDTMELSYTGAGYQAPLLLRLGSGEDNVLYSEGPPITTVLPTEMLDLREDVLTLTPGSTLLLSTDGLLEEEVDGCQYYEQLNNVFFANSHLPPDQIVEVVRGDFCLFNNGFPQGNDDLTFLVLHSKSARK